MSEAPHETRRTCPHCGAELSTAGVCWLCRLDAPTSAVGKLPSTTQAQSGVPIQFGLDSILLLTTFVAVLSGVFAVAPGVAVVAALLSRPALTRTASLARRDRTMGQPMKWGAKALTFLATTSFVVVLLAAMGIAFYATCWVGFWGGAFAHELVDSGAGFDAIGTGLIVGSLLGIIAAVFVMWWLIRRVVKTNYHVPAWTSWCGFVAALAGFVLFAIFHSRDTEVLSFVLSVSGIGLVFSLLGLGAPRRWACAWGTGLAVGPIAASLAIVFTPDDKAWLESIFAPLAATLVTALVAIPLHLWVMQKRGSQTG